MHPIDVARLEEGRRGRGAARLASEARFFTGGGVALRSAPGSWINFAVGMGLEGPVPEGEVEAVAAWYESAGIEPRVELTPYADASVLRGCAAAGLTLREFNTLLWRRTDTIVRPEREGPAGLELRVIDVSDEEEAEAFAWVVDRGFTPPHLDPSPLRMERTRRYIALDRVVAVGAFVNGRLVGGGTLAYEEEVGTLQGMSVLEAWRGRGIQQSLIAERCRLAAERGVPLVTIMSRPHAATERNALRLGFQVAYTKTTLAKSGPGLRAVGT